MSADEYPDRYEESVSPAGNENNPDVEVEVKDGGGGGRHKFGVRSGMINMAEVPESKKEIDELSCSSDETMSSTKSSKKKKSRTEKLQSRILSQLTNLMGQMMKLKKKPRKGRAGPDSTTEELSDSSDDEVEFNFKPNRRPEGMEVQHGDEEGMSHVDESKTRKLKEETNQMKTQQKNDDIRYAKEDRIRETTHRPLIMPDKYDGSTDWKEYASHFESCCEINNWKDEESAKYLAASLRGQALRLLEEQRGTKWNFEEIKSKLSFRFSSAKQAESYLLELRNRKRRQGESLQELGRHIRELTDKAYPNFESQGVDRLARIHFTDAIRSSEIRMGIFHAKATSLDEVIQAAITTETFLQTETERNGWKVKPAYNRGIGSEVDLEKMIKDEVNKVLGQVMESQPNKERCQEYVKKPGANQRPSQTVQGRFDVKPQTCFYCEKPGHFARECREKQMDRRGRNYPSDESNWSRQRYQRQSNDKWSPQRVVARPNVQN